MSDGSVHLINSEKTKVVEFPNGSKNVIFADGRVIEMKVNGEIITHENAAAEFDS